ncbi:hypothetical protein [Aurantiacibacter luteus]|uniref:CBM-cenC domain-containing protein n=1 Tax=Aurantiacibacter luteus TaxID=1581420 RepID=A0A0G9MY36_9SPHN|nr:hypothetical protein [Aurantiacibacter luteus]KLE35687.1 hypothetical protein AAW00_04630 [Aurantiacibacter luteus]
MRALRAVLAVAALLCAPVLALQALANTRELPGPLGWNGFWQASIARQFVTVAIEDERPVMAIRPGGVEMARAAYAREPFATDALFLLASAMQVEGRSDEAARVLAAGLTLDKRSQYLGAMEIQAAVAASDYERALGAIDRLARVRPMMTGDFVGAFATVLGQEGAEPVVLQALENKPVWAVPFWLQVPTDPGTLARFYNLRLLTDEGTSANSDARLMTALAAAGMHQQVFELWDRAGKGADNPTGFVQTGGENAFGWQAPPGQTGNFSQRGEGRFRLYVDAGQEVELARQLVRLAPGSYRFEAQVDPASDAEAVSVKLQCAAAPDGAGAQEHTLAQFADFTASSGCRFYWLILTGDAFENRSALQATVSAIRFGPAGGA